MQFYQLYLKFKARFLARRIYLKIVPNKLASYQLAKLTIDNR